jgi:hypothetical protein
MCPSPSSLPSLEAALEPGAQKYSSNNSSNKLSNNGVHSIAVLLLPALYHRMNLRRQPISAILPL